ncbi:MAG: hypothetical protein RIT06_384 [Chloroflexota bacterium]|jgi:6-phosphogluconolactonase
MPRILQFLDAQAAAAALADIVIEHASAAVTARGRFDFCTTGGSTPGALYRALREPSRAGRMPWGATHLWLGDDRRVSRTSADSNLAAVDGILLATSGAGLAPLPATPIVHPWATENPDARAAARGYLTEARAEVTDCTAAGTPIFDLVLIGVGTDGHCLSVFPHSPLADSAAPLTAAVDAPTHITPHLPRLSFSLGILAPARAVCAVATGAAKAAVVAKIFNADGAVAEAPARAALLDQATWLLDAAAAAGLTAR